MRRFADISFETTQARRDSTLTVERYLALEREAAQALRRELEQDGDLDSFHEIMQNIWGNDPREWAKAGRPITPPAQKTA